VARLRLSAGEPVRCCAAEVSVSVEDDRCEGRLVASSIVRITAQVNDQDCHVDGVQPCAACLHFAALRTVPLAHGRTPARSVVPAMRSFPASDANFEFA